MREEWGEDESQIYRPIRTIEHFDEIIGRPVGPGDEVRIYEEDLRVQLVVVERRKDYLLARERGGNGELGVITHVFPVRLGIFSADYDTQEQEKRALVKKLKEEGIFAEIGFESSVVDVFPVNP